MRLALSKRISELAIEYGVNAMRLVNVPLNINANDNNILIFIKFNKEILIANAFTEINYR